MKLNTVKFVLCYALLTVSSVLAVTEQEVQKIRDAVPNEAIVKPVKPHTMLVFSLCNGFKHGCVPYWDKTLDIMGEKTGAFKVVHSTDMGVFTPESLSQFDVICFNNTTNLTPDASQQKAIMDFITGGKGIVGIHAATDNFYDWPEGMDMMGGIFSGHPWTANGTWAVKLDDPGHPLMKSFHNEGFKINDEIYRTAPPQYSRDKQRVLMSLDMSDTTTKDAKGVTPQDMDTGISWIKSVGKGRLFYCSLGHNPHLTWNKTVLEHYLSGIQYAAGDLKVDDTPLGAASSGLDVSALNTMVERVSRSDWDSGRADALELAALIRSYSKDAGVLGKIEEKLLAALQADPTMTARDFFCRQLAIIGTDKSVPVLSEMLTTPEMSNPARYALEKIPGPAVDQALVKAALASSNEDARIGIITTLGVRKSESVIALSKSLLGDKTDLDSPTVVAIIQALGSVGTGNAVAELRTLRSHVKGQSLLRCADAMLMCANAMQAAGQTTDAIGIYREMYKTGPTSLVQAAGLCGLAKTDPANVESLIKQAITGDDGVLQTAAIQSLVTRKDDTVFLKTVAASASNLPKSAQVQLVAVMAQASRDIGHSLAVDLLGSDEESVRIAACQAIRVVGDASDIERLARVAAETKSRQERQAAQDALYRLAGEGIDRVILQKIADYKATQLDENSVAELIKATVNRQIKKAPEVLFRTADSDSRKISEASIAALPSLAGPEYMEELVGLIISKPAANTEKALIAIAEKIPDRNDRAAILLDQYPKMVDNEKAQVSMLNVMGKLGDVHAVSLLRKEFASDKPAIQQAAFRAMVDWPGSDFTDDMKDLAQTATESKNKILAFRAYVRMLDSAVTDENRAITRDALFEAYQIASRSEEKKIVIGVLGHYYTIETLTFLQKAMEEPDLMAEVQTSMMQICEKLLPQHPESVRPILASLEKDGFNESIKKKAAEVLAKGQ